MTTLLTDLLGAEVRDGNGRYVGVVHDVRAIQDGPQAGELGRMFRVSGLLVGPRYASRFGMSRPEVKGPLALKWLSRWLGRRIELIPWDQVQSVEDRSVSIRRTRT